MRNAFSNLENQKGKELKNALAAWAVTSIPWFKLKELQITSKDTFFELLGRLVGWTLVQYWEGYRLLDRKQLKEKFGKAMRPYTLDEVVAPDDEPEELEELTEEVLI